MQIKNDTPKNNDWIKSNFAWCWVKFWQPPARPIPQELAYIKKVLEKQIRKKGANFSVLVLGSTSEYRDLLINLGCKATVVDFSRENYQILSEKMEHKQDYTKWENFIQNRWQNLDFHEKFDLVLGHFIFGVNPLQEWPDILKGIKQVLKTNGLFMTTSWIRLKKDKLDLKNILEIYKKKWTQKYDLWAAMMAPLFLCAYNAQEEYMAYKDLAEIIEKAWQKGEITQGDYQHFINCGFKEFDFKLTIPLEDKTSDLFSKHFRKVKKVYFKDYPSYQYIPLFVAQK